MFAWGGVVCPGFAREFPPLFLSSGNLRSRNGSSARLRKLILVLCSPAYQTFPQILLVFSPADAGEPREPAFAVMKN